MTKNLNKGDWNGWSPIDMAFLCNGCGRPIRDAIRPYPGDNKKAIMIRLNEDNKASTTGTTYKYHPHCVPSGSDVEKFWIAPATFMVRLTAQEMDDILVGCFEGGSNYWIEFGVVFDPTCEVEMLEMKNGFASEYVGLGGTLWIPVKDDGQKMICPVVSEKLAKKHGFGDLPLGYDFLALDGMALFHGYQRYINHQLAKDRFYPDMDHMDASDHDSILQMALFGELVYG